MEKKYGETIVPFEKARQLEAGGKELISDQHRILIDSLVIACGISDDLKEVR